MASNNKTLYLFLIADTSCIAVLGAEDGHKINPGYIFQKVNITFSHTYTHTNTLFRKFLKFQIKNEKNEKISITARLQSQQSLSKQWQALTKSSSMQHP